MHDIHSKLSSTLHAERDITQHFMTLRMIIAVTHRLYNENIGCYWVLQLAGTLHRS